MEGFFFYVGNVGSKTPANVSSSTATFLLTYLFLSVKL